MSGLGWALLSGAEEAYIFETSKSENKSYRNALSDVTIADEAATIGGLIGATIFTKYFGLQQTLLTAAALLVIATFVSIIVLSEPSQHLSEVATNKESLASGGLQFLKRHSQYFLIMVVFAVYYEGGRLLWQPQLVNNGIQLYQLGVLFAFFKLFSIGGSLAAKKLAPQQFKEPLLLAGFILAMTFLMISSSTLALILIGFCIYSFAENYTRVLQSDYLNKAITHNRAGFLSLNNIVRNGYSAAIAPFLGVLALTKVSKGFIFLAVAQVLAIIVLALVMGAKKQPI